MRCEFCCRISTSANKVGITFHNFPKHDVTKKAWIKACVSRGCELDENMNIKTKRLCSNHFAVNDFEEDPSLVRRKLKKNVVPTLFSRKPFIYCIACNDIASELSDVDLHEFPEDVNLKKKWADVCRQNGCDIKNIHSQYALCSSHFSTNCFIQNGQGRKYLKQDSVPFTFSISASSNSVEQCKKPVTNANVSGSTSSVLANVASSPVGQWEESVVATDFVECTLGLTENVTSSLKQCEKPVTNASVSSTSNVPTNVASSPVEQCDDVSMDSCSDISTNSANTTDIDNKSGTKRRLPFVDNPTPKSPLTSESKLKIWRPARVGDLREEHFDTPEKAKIHFHLLSSKCKEYQKQLAHYRSKVWRLEKKVKTLEQYILTQKKCISEETAAKIST